MDKILIYLTAPQQVIPSLSAVLSLNNEKRISVTVLVHSSNPKKEISDEIATITKKLTKNFSFIDKVFAIDKKKISEIFSRPTLLDSKSKFQYYFGLENYQEIYYAHSIDEIIYPFLCLIYPKAKRVCFGDGYGFVFRKKEYYNLMYFYNPFTTKVINFFINILRKIFIHKIEDLTGLGNSANLVFREYQPHIFALILPIFQYSPPKDIPLVIVKKNVVKNVIKSCISSVPELNNYIERLLNVYKKQKKTLLLTENFYEWGFIDLNKEVLMFSKIIRKYYKGGAIFIKPHPIETFSRARKIKNILGNTIKPVVIDNQYKYYPVELWKNFLINCKVICSSTPILSLKYLYNLKVIQPMDKSFIEQWFPKWTWKSLKNSIELYSKPLKNLKKWNSNTILYKP